MTSLTTAGSQEAPLFSHWCFDILSWWIRASLLPFISWGLGGPFPSADACFQCLVLFLDKFSALRILLWNFGSKILYHIKISALVSYCVDFLFCFLGDCLIFILYLFNWVCYSLYLKFYWIFLFIVSCLWFHRYSSFSYSLMISIMYILKIFTVFYFYLIASPLLFAWKDHFHWEAVLKCLVILVGLLIF